MRVSCRSISETCYRDDPVFSLLLFGGGRVCVACCWTGRQRVSGGSRGNSRLDWAVQSRLNITVSLGDCTQTRDIPHSKGHPPQEAAEMSTALGQ